MKASSKRPRVKSSQVLHLSLLQQVTPTVEAYVDPIAVVDPPPSSSGDSSSWSTLDIVMTVQAAHRQLLVDVLTKLQALHADLANARRSSPPPPFDDKP